MVIPRGTQTEDVSPQLYERVTQTDPQNHELIARRWLKAEGLYCAPRKPLHYTFMHHWMCLLRQPRGRVEGQGSQQAMFEMNVPSEALARELCALIGAESKGATKYSVVTKRGKQVVEWRPSTTTSTWWLSDAEEMYEKLALHTRGLNNNSLRGSAKLVPPAQGYKKSTVLVLAVPPLIIEVATLTGGRVKLTATVNVAAAMGPR